MQIRFINKADFLICGYSVETSLDDSSKDVAELYSDYFNTEKASLIDNAVNNKATEYYGLMWYLEGHERYNYLLGKETANLSAVPAEAETKLINAALYAVSYFERAHDNAKAWTDFFFEAIPQAGFAPDYEHGFFFEYYPEGVNGNYELWTPVVKADIEDDVYP